MQRATFRELARLALRNAALTLATLTLYRFWARTHLRRRLWARTEVLGDALEYGGEGWELFRGFLISLPTFFLPAVFVIYLAPLAFEPATAGLLAFAFYVAAVPLIAAGRYWMRRYQLSRTRWRGIRFALVGSGWSFALASSGWTLLQIITLGWFTPAARMRRAHYMWGNTRFGDQPFDFGVGEPQLARGLYGPFALGWFGTPFGFLFGAVVGAFAASIIVLAFGGLALLQRLPAGDLGAAPLAVSAIGVFIFAFAIAGAALAWTPYTAAAMKRIASLLSLDGARFQLEVTIMGLMGVTVAGALIFVFSLGLLAPLSGAIYARYVLNRLTLIGQPRFAEIAQPIAAAPASGEGMADAFDFDFGVGVV